MTADRRTLPGSRTPRILELHAAGTTPREIAGALRISTQAVYKVLGAHGAKPNRKAPE